MRKFWVLLIFMIFCDLAVQSQEAFYKVRQTDTPLKIDGVWDKTQWKLVPEILIANVMGKMPEYKPVVRAKIQYDRSNIYVIFKVKDKFVSSLVQESNGPVSRDACVEFFFSPVVNAPLNYFNLETNAGGTKLMSYHGEVIKRVVKADLEEVVLAHSLPNVISPPIMKEVEWIIEYRIPFSLLKKYTQIAMPNKGVRWRANLYKTASTGLNPHYITWSVVENYKPNFHLPACFGVLEFE